MPNDIQTNLNRLINVKTDIANAITDAGGTVSVGDGLEEFADDINNRFDEVNSEIESLLTYKKSRTITTNFTTGVTTFSGSSVNDINTYQNMRRCNVADDGTINAFYGDSNFSYTGSNGQVMVYVPKFYYKVNHTDVTDNAINIGSWSIANGQLPGYTVHPAFINANRDEIDYFLIGAFESVAQRTSYPYDYSANTNAINSSYFKPVSAAPSNMVPTRALTSAFRSWNADGWYELGVRQYAAIQMLFAVEYGFNAITSVGLGVANNNITSCMYVGSTQSLGNTTGQAASSSNSSGTYTADGYKSVSYRGIENLWGNVCSFVDGLFFVYNGNVYVQTDYNFTPSAVDKTLIGFNVPYNSLSTIDKFGYDSNFDWLFLPISYTSSSNVFSKDGYYYMSNAIGDYESGGYYLRKETTGMFGFIINNYQETSPTAEMGGRTMYIPS